MSQFKWIKQVLNLLLVSMILSSCGVKQFSNSSPFAVELGRVRSYYQAQKLEQRLKKMKIRAYMVVLADEMDQSSKWYVMLCGAKKDTVEAVKLQMELGIKYKLKDLETVNYLRLKPYLLPFDKAALEEIENMNAIRPDLPENIYELIEKFPKSDILNIEDVGLYNFPKEGVPSSQFSSFYNASLDLPRGISKATVVQKAEAFAEVIYKDNLYGDQVTVDVLKLSKDHNIQGMPRARLTQNGGSGQSHDPDHIAWYFAAMILNTGTYTTEEYEKIVVQSYTALHGYKVVIEPGGGQLRTYMILVDIVGGFVIFSQSTQKTDLEILEYLSNFGKSKGMLDYSEFHNTFFTIPKCLEAGDVFLGFHSEILGNDYAYNKGYANWAKAMVGHAVSTTDFYNTQLRMAWGCSAFDLLTYSKKDYIYNDMYRSQRSSGKISIKVNDSDGFYISEYYIREINFPTPDRHVLAVFGTGMSRDNLLIRAKKFQTGKLKVGMDPCQEQAAPPAPGPNDPGPDPDDPGPDDPGPDPDDPGPGPGPDPPPPPTPDPKQPSGGKSNHCGEGHIVTQYPSSGAHYRQFQFETDLGPVEAGGLNAAFQALQTQVNFLMPSSDERPVKHCLNSNIDFTLHKGNPVVLKVDASQHSVSGYSLPGHLLHPCWFKRSLVVKKGKLVLLTSGETLSNKVEVQEWVAWFYWKKADQLFQAHLKGQ